MASFLPSDHHKPTVRNLTIEDAWLNLDSAAITVEQNPLLHRQSDDKEMLGLHEMRLMKTGQYLEWAAKVICNIELLPIQAAILAEVWSRPFPMYIASRGFGKSERDTHIITDSGFIYINDLFNDNDPYEQQIPVDFKLMGENGFERPEYAFKEYAKPTVKTITNKGFFIEGSLIHPLRVVDNGQIVWKQSQDLKLGDRVVIDRNSNNEWFSNTNDINSDTAYMFGCLVGDGGYTVRGSISFTTSDKELVDVINVVSNKMWGKVFRSRSAKYQYILCGVDIWDELFQKYGFRSSDCAEKCFPDCIMGASKESVAAFIRGLFDTDGCIRKTQKLWLEYASKSSKLVRTLQFILTRFGIISRVRKRYNKKYDRYYWYLYIWGDDVKLFAREIGFGLERKQKILDGMMDCKTNTNKDVLPHKLVLDKLLRVRNVFMGNYIFGGHDYNYERQSISIYKLKKYELSYKKFREILDIFARVDICRDMQEYKDLRDIQNKHYFFDTITKLESGFNELYDFYLPKNHNYISGGFISHNTFMLGLYSLLRCILIPKTKVVIVGAAFRQSKFVFEYMETIWNNAPLLRSVCDNNSGASREADRWTMRINDSWAVAIPIGDGSKIRGLRATTIVTDEFGSVPPAVYETVIAGFASVTATPVENVKIMARRKRLEELGLLTEESLKLLAPLGGNQSILSGTAGYDFEHFAEYWNRYKRIIESRGNKEKLSEIFDGDLPTNFSWQDYSIVRIPYALVPPGFMDERNIARSKVTMDSSIFGMEYNAIFVKDSNGFFKRSLIESCVAKDIQPIVLGKNEIVFSAAVRGFPDLRYVYGVDPASEKDNFSITVLELHAEHTRIVYCWTTNRRDFRARVKAGLVKEHDFYSFCARKLRDLMKIFPCVRIGMDAQGGGIAVEEALHDLDKLEEGELQIWPIIDPEKEADTDILSGLHILEMVQFAKADWTSEANHGMRKDLEDKVLLFPQFDPVAIALAAEGDARSMQVDDPSHIYDSLETCMLEIEELKNELATIVLTRTGTGVNSRDRWDTPETKTSTGTKGRLRKDRYSALVIANMLARTMGRMRPDFHFSTVGGFAHMVPAGTKGQMYSGPEWFTQSMSEQTCVAVKK